MVNPAARLLAVVAPFVILASGLQAQSTLAVAVGSRIRVQAQGDSSWRVGRLSAVAPDTIRLRMCDNCADDAYPLRSLSAVQVSVGRIGRRSTILKGAFLGAAIGIAAGAWYGSQKSHGCSSEASFCGIEYLAVPFFGAGGLAIGAAIGSSYHYDDWRIAAVR